MKPVWSIAQRLGANFELVGQKVNNYRAIAQLGREAGRSSVIPCRDVSKGKLIEMTFTTLLFGKDGQVGSALHPRLLKLGNVIAHNRESCDLNNDRELRNVIRRVQPSIIVNAAAYTAVDDAETEIEVCNYINAEVPAILADEAHRIGAGLVHYSTNYVFNGQKATPYVEEDHPSPLGVYAQSKFKGDLAITQRMDNYTILRVGWVYGMTGRSFAKRILQLASEREELRIVADQFGTPTSAEFIADITAQLLREYYLSSGDAGRLTNARGMLNVAPSGRSCWHQYAVELVREAKRLGWPIRVTEENILAVTSDQFPAPAVRPRNSVLDTAKLRGLLGIEVPAWQDHLNLFVARLYQARIGQ
jgi:dTDP-4-dehydrorhamnose reductase